MLPHALLNGRYLGGHPGRARETQALLRINEDGVRVEEGLGSAFVKEPWAKITELAAEGPDQVATRVTATRLLLAGPLALAFKKEQKVGYIAVRGEFGEFLFEVKGKTPQELRAKIAPWLGSIHLVSAEESATSGDTITQLQALADLRDRGALTEEEFAREKSRLLDNG